MRGRQFMTLSATLAVVLGALIFQTVFAQQAIPKAGPTQQVEPPIYNPYPPGILPSDLVPEIARVRREIQGIFIQALEEWLALPPPNVQGQPPTLQDS